MQHISFPGRGVSPLRQAPLLCRSNLQPPSNNTIRPRFAIKRSPPRSRHPKISPRRFQDDNHSASRSTCHIMTGFPPDNGPAATPPVPPPKPGSHEASGISTPVPYGASGTPGSFSSGAQHGATTQGQPGGQDPGAAFAPEQQASPIPEDPGEHWLPHILEDKSYVEYRRLPSPRRGGEMLLWGLPADKTIENKTSPPSYRTPNFSKPSSTHPRPPTPPPHTPTATSFRTSPRTPPWPST